MKVKKKIFIVIVGYIVAIIVLFLGANYYVENKDNRLRTQAYERFDNFFRNQNKFVDTQYANRRIKYTQTVNPEEKPNGLLGYHRLESWNDKFSDIYRFFKIDAIDDGWHLFVAENFSYGTMILYDIYPSYVGYRRQENSYMYNWIPAVEVCVNEAYDFWVNNSKSNYIDFYQRGNMNRVYDLIRDVPNEYYTWYSKKQVYQLNTFNEIGTAGWMFNGYYKVFAERTEYRTYEIERRDYALKSDKEDILITGGIILTVIFMCFLIPLILQYNRIEKKKRENKEEYEKKKNESVYDKLIDLCSPAKFMNPYDKEKVEKANSIYEQLMKTSSSDIETLKKLRRQAIDELNLNFINVEYFQDLKSKCNPERFLQPYDAEKVRIANEIYKKLIDNENSIEILEEVEKEIKEKLHYERN